MRRLPCLLLTGVALLHPALLRAQTAAGVCTYAECSLRLEGNRLIRGRDLVIGRTTLTGMPRLASLVAPTDSVQTYARTFDRLYPRSRWMLVASGALAGLALGLALDRIDAPERGFVVGLGTSSAVLGGVGWYLDRRATHALGDALWWHNGALVRDDGAPHP